MEEELTKDYIKRLGYDAYINLVNKIKGPSTKDRFESEGLITPEQFVSAGDLLTNKCKTWTWESGSEYKKFTYLPSDKQFLMTRRVPCKERVSNIDDFNIDTTDEMIGHYCINNKLSNYNNI